MTLRTLGNHLLPPEGEPRCEDCKNFAWGGGSRMVARWENGEWHHPSCRKLPENAKRLQEREGW